MNIILTRKCNLTCDFCRVSKEEVNLDMNNLVRFLDLYKKTLPLERLKFLGGEPTLQWINLKSLIEQYPDLIFEINTNGKLLDEKIIDFIRMQENIELNISFDFEKWVPEEGLELIKRLALKGVKNLNINWVVQPREYSNQLIEEILNLQVKEIRVLPVLYQVWSDEELKILRKNMEKISNHKNSGKLRNRCYAHDNNFLANNQITVDANGELYASDISMLDFYDGVRDKVKFCNIEDLQTQSNIMEIRNDNHKLNEIKRNVRTYLNDESNLKYNANNLILKEILEEFVSCEG